MSPSANATKNSTTPPRAITPPRTNTTLRANTPLHANTSRPSLASGTENDDGDSVVVEGKEARAGGGARLLPIPAAAPNSVLFTNSPIPVHKEVGGRTKAKTGNDGADAEVPVPPPILRNPTARSGTAPGMSKSSPQWISEPRGQRITLSDSVPHRLKSAELWRSGTLCDVELMVGGEAFRAHRLILAEESEYMQDALAKDWMSSVADGSLSVTSTRVNLGDDINSKYFSMVLDWMYTCQLSVAEGPDFEGILDVASHLKCNQLLSKLEGATIQKLSVNNCVQRWDMGEKYRLSSLVEKSMRMATNRYLEVMCTSGFLRLPLDRLVKILSSDELGIESEEEVFNSVVRWARAQEEGSTPTSDELGELFSTVRFPHMSERFVREVVETEPLLLNSHAGLLAFAHSFVEASNGCKKARRQVGSGVKRWQDNVIRRKNRRRRMRNTAVKTGPTWDQIRKDIVVPNIETLRDILMRPSPDD